MAKEADFQNRDRFLALGFTIAALRKAEGLTQAGLAQKANISRSHLNSIEAPNITHAFSLEIFMEISDALGVRAGDLLNTTFQSKDQ